MIELQSKPGFRGDAEVSPESQRRVGGNGTGPTDDHTDAVWRDVDITRQLINADPERSHEIFEEYFSRVDRIEFCHTSPRLPSGIIHYFDVKGMVVLPNKIDAPLIVAADTVS